MIDIVYTAWNRRDFTIASVGYLLLNTDWDLVRQVVVYDDGSSDGTREILEEHLLPMFPVDVVLRAEQGLGPVALTQRYLDGDPLPVFAKVDNDVAVPPRWLNRMLDVLDDHPDVELLGMEAGMTSVAGRDGNAFDGVYGFEPATNIGGVGLFRASAFACRPRMRPDGRNGFSEWQHTHAPTRGWITPDLPVVLLDRLPFEPWLSLSESYVEAGWQRPWGKYDERWMGWCWDWMTATKAAA